MDVDPQLARMIEVMASDDSQLVKKLGIRLTELSAERLAATMPVSGNQQPFGLLHGGASAALAETLGSIHAMVASAPDGAAVGVDLNITHHRSPRGPLVTGVCTPLHVGGSVAAFDIVITDDPDGPGAGRRISTARLTCAILPRTRLLGGPS